MIMPYSMKPTGVPAGTEAPDKVNFDRLWDAALQSAIDKAGYEPISANEVMGSQHSFSGSGRTLLYRSGDALPTNGISTASKRQSLSDASAFYGAAQHTELMLQLGFWPPTGIAT
jgi:hypothetical protein